MTHGLSAIDRILVGLAGLAALALGLWAVAWAFDLNIAHQLLSYIDLSKAESFFTTSWFTLTRILLAVLALIIGVWLVIANLRRRRFNVISIEGEITDAGAVDVASVAVAKAVAENLETHPSVESVRPVAQVDRKCQTITWNLDVSPYADIDSVLEKIDESEEDFRAAIPNTDLHTRYLLHMQPVES